MRHALLFVLLAAAMTLAGCFGGGGGSSSSDGSGPTLQLSGTITPSAKISKNLFLNIVPTYDSSDSDVRTAFSSAIVIVNGRKISPDKIVITNLNGGVYQFVFKDVLEAPEYSIEVLVKNLPLAAKTSETDTVKIDARSTAVWLLSQKTKISLAELETKYPAMISQVQADYENLVKTSAPPQEGVAFDFYGNEALKSAVERAAASINLASKIEGVEEGKQAMVIKLTMEAGNSQLLAGFYDLDGDGKNDFAFQPLGQDKVYFMKPDQSSQLSLYYQNYAKEEWSSVHQDEMLECYRKKTGLTTESLEVGKQGFWVIKLASLVKDKYAVIFVHEVKVEQALVETPEGSKSKNVASISLEYEVIEVEVPSVTGDQFIQKTVDGDLDATVSRFGIDLPRRDAIAFNGGNLSSSDNTTRFFFMQGATDIDSITTALTTKNVLIHSDAFSALEAMGKEKTLNVGQVFLAAQKVSDADGDEAYCFAVFKIASKSLNEIKLQYKANTRAGVLKFTLP